ncbi:hypothetical protein PybrP1_004538 [[Pythium] brassicae (nom. inval.)]|nr:hypothetical protein PybrP1_004538 [[Pythium] brassicae (nom. inval.)]
MSPLEETKVPRCLSPQDKLKSGSSALLAAQRSSSKKADTKKDAADADSGWISDDNLRAMDLDERLNQDIDWVVVRDDSLDLSLAMDFEQDSGDQDVVSDFGFGPAAYLSPLRGRLVTFEDAFEVAPSFECVGLDLAESNAADAESLLMSFDTMNFTIPSPTSSSSKKRRASLFGNKPEPSKVARSATAASAGSMSPSLKLKVSARPLSPEELLVDAASKPSLSSAAVDPLLGVLSITVPTGEHAAGGEPGRKIGSYSPAARKLRIQKFHEKRKNRTWKKSIKYDCRKKLADDRPRIKGRFVRVLENMCDGKDDEPLTPSGQLSPVSFSSFTPPVTPMSTPGSLSPQSLSPMTPAAFAAAVGMVAAPSPASFSPPPGAPAASGDVAAAELSLVSLPPSADALTAPLAAATASLIASTS